MQLLKVSPFRKEATALLTYWTRVASTSFTNLFFCTLLHSCLIFFCPVCRITGIPLSEESSATAVTDDMCKSLFNQIMRSPHHPLRALFGHREESRARAIFRSSGILALVRSGSKFQLLSIEIGLSDAFQLRPCVPVPFSQSPLLVRGKKALFHSLNLLLAAKMSIEGLEAHQTVHRATRLPNASFQ